MTGERRAVTPISALKLYRISAKRMLAEGDIDGDSNERKVALNSKLDGKGEYKKKDPPTPSTSPPFLCLLENPIFSLQLGITELAGPAGAGKTQLALSLCADCVLKKTEENGHCLLKSKCLKQNKAVYIQLGGSSRFLQIISRRLEQMLRSRLGTKGIQRNQKSNGTGYRGSDVQDHYSDDDATNDYLTHILVHWVCNSEELMEVLQKRLPRILYMHPTISLVVLDSIANLFRLLPEEEQHQLFENGDKEDRQGRSSNPWHDRAVAFFQISNLCKELSSRFKVPFVVLNECTNRIPTSNAHKQQQQPKSTLEPALGLAWSQCVNCSYFIQRDTAPIPIPKSQPCRDGRESDHSIRMAKLKIWNKEQLVCSRIMLSLKAPHISSEHSRAKFSIGQSGVIPI